MSFSNSTIMDPEVWGNLQYHISLENVYLMLPLREFFQLRGVCKDWNCLARQRRCLTDPIHKPYFVVAYPKLPFVSSHIGILTFHIASGHWNWNHHYLFRHERSNLYELFSVKGLVLNAVDHKRLQVYDAHTKSVRRIPGARNMAGRLQSLGMAVDTSVIPYSFKIIFGGLASKTQIYDSTTNSWETRPSFIPYVPSKTTLYKSCVHCDNHLYIWSDAHSILVYSLNEDRWTLLNPPPRNKNGRMEVALGSWEGRVFAVIEDGGELSLSVWELVDRSRQVWRHFERIPFEMQAWLMPQHFRGSDSIRIFANFCDEYVFIQRLLVKSCYNGELSFISEKNVLFNLASKQWEKVDISNAENIAESP